MEITLITGGQRSGKSSFAQKLAEEKSDNPIYLATARIWDDDFKTRVKRHQSDRGEFWKTIEENKQISKHNFNKKTVLMDCVTLWLTNFFYDNNFDVEKSLEETKSEWDKFIKQDFNLIVVTNELGMGIHAENETSRKFTDLQGWINQHIAKSASNVYLMVSGISTKIK
ncbi:MAG: bifunctional adenosylcobinamide kinase/adenosylcobinamide-phosphate guanylyltransferase [Bacteroidota bacterium]|nr:bifunctional adenosylcobinamide kinase/adenosylcobinamide-phosphate guanylyltransferase [Bacteroidota bacterium]